MENYSDISKNFIPYDLALELKELGFDEECLALYQSNHNNKPFININNKINIEALLSGKIKNEGIQYLIKVPLWQQAFRFFREKYGLHYIICKNIQMDGYGYREVILIPYMEENENTIFKTYEEAELACIKKLIEIAKEQNVK